MLRAIYEEEYVDPESINALVDDAYIQGLQDMKDAILLFCREIYGKNMKVSQIWNALDEFLKSIDKDILEHKERIMKSKFPETWIYGIPKIRNELTIRIKR